MIHPELGLGYAVHLNSRSARKATESAVDIKPFHKRPVELRHVFMDAFAPGGGTLDLLRLSMQEHRCIR